MTLREWAILLEVARGEMNRWDQELDGLLAEGVVEVDRNIGSVTLTQQGRIALGLSTITTE